MLLIAHALPDPVPRLSELHTVDAVFRLLFMDALKAVPVLGQGGERLFNVVVEADIWARFELLRVEDGPRPFAECDTLRLALQVSLRHHQL